MVTRDLIAKLGIKPGNRVCLIRPNQDILSQIRRTGNVTALVDKIEAGCDIILYWFDPAEDIKEKMLDLQTRIKPNGKIWLIIPKKEIARKKNLNIDWNQIQKEILKTKLVDNKIASINEEEYGTQFVIRKELRGKK